LVSSKPDNQHIQAIPVHQARELIVVPGTETATQKHRISLELVRDINTITNKSSDMIIARRLPSGDILVTFQDILKKQK